MSRLFRIPAAVAGIAVLAISTASPCAGWEATPEERHDCCERRQCQHAGELGQTGASQARADQCCAQSERGTADRTEQARLLPALQLVAPIDDILPALFFTQLSPPHVPLRPPASIPIHLLHSVFQI